MNSLGLSNTINRLDRGVVLEVGLWQIADKEPLPDLQTESGSVRSTRHGERNMESRRSSTPLVREDLDFRCSP